MARTDSNARRTGLMALGLISSAWAQDVGTPSKEQIEQASAEASVFALCQTATFPTRPFFGDTHLHTSFSMDAGAFGARLRPRDAYRFARGEEVTASSGPAGEALAPARLPRGRRSLRQHGLLPRPVRGQARDARRPDRPQVVRHDPVRQGRGGRDRDHRRLLAGDVPEGPHVLPGHARLPQRLAGDDRRRRGIQRAGPLHRLHRLRVDLEHRRQQPAPQRHLPRQRRQGEPGRAVHRLSAAAAATTRATCGSGWTPTSRRPAAACSPSRTTAT